MFFSALFRIAAPISAVVCVPPVACFDLASTRFPGSGARGASAGHVAAAQPMATSVHVLLADGHALFREGVRQLLEAERGYVVVGEASDGLEALRLTQQLNPDILLLDWVMPLMTGAGVLDEIADGSLRTRAILVTSSMEERDVQVALELGARGIVLKASGFAVLQRAIVEVMAGQYWIARDTVAALIGVLRGASGAHTAWRSKPDFGLTSRELEIVSAVAAAYSNKEIAQRFSISEKTVKHHLTNIFDKIGVSNRLELVLFALGHHLNLLDLTAPPEASARKHSGLRY
jgi:DNA-binding NarL/FixJ family response regulator